MNEQHNGTGEVLALDLGGTKIAGAVVHTDGRILYLTQRPTPAQAGAAAIIKAMADVVDELRQRCTIEPRGVGIGAAGVIDQNTAKVLSATDTLKGWAGTEIARELGVCTQLPVPAVNGVHAHGLGEAKFGAGAAASSVLLVAVGTGIGGAFFTQEQLITGFNHVAGHAGHIDSSFAVGIKCSCGRHAHVEAIASGPSIYRHYQRLANNPDVSDTKAVTALAEAGDANAHQAVRTGGLAAGSAIASLANVLDPERIIIAGGVAGAGELWWQALRARYAASAIHIVQDTELVPATLGNDAALIGAASLIEPTN